MMPATASIASTSLRASSGATSSRFRLDSRSSETLGHKFRPATDEARERVGALPAGGEDDRAGELTPSLWIARHTHGTRLTPAANRLRRHLQEKWHLGDEDVTLPFPCPTPVFASRRRAPRRCARAAWGA